jgi:hypothetical protein
MNPLGESPGARPARRGGRLAVLFALLAVGSGAALVTDRELGHLAVWSVRESTSPMTFRAPAPSRPPSPTVTGGDLERAMVVARHVITQCARPSRPDPVRWTTIEDMRQQVRSGATADCWPRSLLFASEAAAAGLDTRLWSLEGNRFEGQAHTVPEVYLRDAARWVMLDVTLNAFAQDHAGAPLGLLDLRDHVLERRSGSLQLRAIEASTPVDLPRVEREYADRCRYAFLRRDAGLDARGRYGGLAPLAAWLDRLPEPVKKGVSAVFGRTGQMLYYHDAHNASLVGPALAAKLCLWIFLGAIAAMLAATTHRSRTEAA